MDSCRIAGGLVLLWAMAGGLASGQTLSRVSLTGNGAEAMWWPSPVWYEGHLTAATTETGTRWALAQGTIDSRGDHETYLLIANPGDTAATVTIDIHGLDSDGQGTQTLGCTRSVPLAAHSRYSTGIKDFCGITSTLGTVNMAGTIVSDGPAIVAERSTYWSANGQFWASGSSTLLTRLP